MAHILSTLERVSETGDPGQRIFDELFRLRPDYEPLFILDTDGSVRGSMLTSCFDCIIGLASGDKTRARLELDAAYLSQTGYGLDNGEVNLVFDVIYKVIKGELNSSWTDQDDQAWKMLLMEFEKIRQQSAF
ncbi:MAG: globin [Pseudomonadota bacterium]